MYFDAAVAAAAANAPQAVQNKEMVPGLVLHLDGDYLAYYAGGNDDTTVAEARLNAFSIIESYRAVVGAESVVVHTTAPGCHKGERYLIATTKPYQGQRVNSKHKPKHKDYLLQLFMEFTGDAFRAKVWTTREADDGIAASAHWSIGKSPGYIAIATRDKDLRMLPGHHIDWVSKQVTVVAPGAFEVIGANGKLYGLKWFWQQMLEGDGADFVPGLEHTFLPNAKGDLTLQKIGPAKAEKLLEDCKTSEEASRVVLDAYLRGYNSSRAWALDRFVEQAALLWMRCDFHGRVCDFAHHAGHSRINHHFDEEVLAAVKRLEDRVTSARTEINSFGG